MRITISEIPYIAIEPASKSEIFLITEDRDGCDTYTRITNETAKKLAEELIRMVG